MSASLVQATFNALSKASLILDDIPPMAFGLIETRMKKSHPDTAPGDLPSLQNGKHMSESEFYLKAAGASLGPKFLISLGLGVLAAGLSFVGLPGLLSKALVPLSLWVSGKSAEKEDDAPETTPKEYKPAWTDKVVKFIPGMKKFMNRLPSRHRRIMGETIKMDVALEMEIMTMTAISLGTSGIATAGILGLVATVALVPVVAFAATSIVWSASFGLRKFRNFIAKRQREITAGLRPKKFFDSPLKFIDNKIEPTFSIVGRLALMAMGGGLLAEHAIIPLAQMAIPHLAFLAPVLQSVIHAFEALPGLARLALQVPLGYGVGKYIYNPLIAPAMHTGRGLAGKIFGHFKKKKAVPVVPSPSPAALVVHISAPASKISQISLSPAFKQRFVSQPSARPALSASKSLTAFAVK